MEDRKELSEILLGNSKQSSNGKKAVLVVVTSIAIIAVVAFLVWKFFITQEKPLAKPNEIIDTSAMKPADDVFNDNFSKLDFGQDNTTLDPINTYGIPSAPQDLNMGFEQDSQNNTNIDNNATDIDSALNNIEDTISPAPSTATTKPTSTPKQESTKPIEKPKPTKQSIEKSKPIEKPSAPTTKPTSTPKQESTKPQPNSNKVQSTNTPIAPVVANGSAPTQGFYWQVGVFEKEPNAKFLATIKKYPYRIQNIILDNKPNARYLIGPYKARAQAPNREEIAKIFTENPTPVEVQ